MPGTLMYECCMHTLRIYLLRMGWVAEAAGSVWEPVPGVASKLCCRGQVLETTKVVTYEVTIREIGYRPEPYVICDALMYADGKPIVEITNMSARLTGTTKEQLLALWQGTAHLARGKVSGELNANRPSTPRSRSWPTATATRPRGSANRTGSSTAAARSPACPDRRSSSWTGSPPCGANRGR